MDGGRTPRLEGDSSHTVFCFFLVPHDRGPRMRQRGIAIKRLFLTSMADLVVGIHHVPALCINCPISREMLVV